MAHRLLRIAAAIAALAPAGTPAALAQDGASARDPVPLYCQDDDQRPECLPARDALGRMVVYLPPLLADLFPNGTGRPGVDRPPSASPRAVTGAFVPDEVLVTIDGDAAAVTEIATRFGLEVRAQRVSGLFGAAVVRYGIPDGRPVSVVLAQLVAESRMRERVPNHLYQLQQAPVMINYAFQRIVLDAGAASGEGIDVAIIDSAADGEHPALAGAIVEGFDALPAVPVELRSHGTSVAGIVGGVGAYRGVAPGTRIHMARAFDMTGTTADALLVAIEWAVERRVRVINMSFVGPPNELFELACRIAYERGIVLVAAAGNNGPGAPFAYPAAYDEVIAVTATDERDGLMQRANRGRYIHVAAPGVDMLAPVPGGGNDVVTGTSFAAPVVTGLIANLLRAAPGRSPADIADLLARSAVDLGEPGHDDDFGYGLINAAGALTLAR